MPRTTTSTGSCTGHMCVSTYKNLVYAGIKSTARSAESQLNSQQCRQNLNKKSPFYTANVIEV